MVPTIELALVGTVTAAAWSDLTTRKIPNWITVSGAVLGVALQTWFGGLHGAWMSVTGAVLGIGIFIGLFIAGGMGAGDVKLFGAVGALIGPQALLLVFVVTGILGGISAIGLAVFRGRLREILDRTGQLLSGLHQEKSADALRLPYGVVIAVGVLLWMMV